MKSTESTYSLGYVNVTAQLLIHSNKLYSIANAYKYTVKDLGKWRL
jgi:hypothetical protein